MTDEEANSFTEISVNELGWQPPRSLRSSSDRGAFVWLRVSNLRCNLTGLSQLYNLYFLANQDSVYVYQLTFPSQQFTAHPALILDLPECLSSTRRGEVDPFHPHAVNRLQVGNLGSEEILLVSCDDGDVIGYHTSAIQRVIDTQEQFWHWRCNEAEDDLPEAFFHKNVGRSAWGLAVHEKARLIAVSANSHVITLFAFALTEQTPHIRSDGYNSCTSSDKDGMRRRKRRVSTCIASDDESKCSDGYGFPQIRDKDCRISLQCPPHNIPSIDFCNTGNDPQGRWLLATNIKGDVMLWDLHKQYLVSLIAIGCVTAPWLHDYVDGNATGWAAMWLDKRSMIKASETAIATRAEDSQQNRYRDGQLRWDVSVSKSKVRVSNTWKVGQEEWREAKSNTPENTEEDVSSSQGFFCDVSLSSEGQRDKAEHNVLDSLPDCPLIHTSSTNIFLLQAGLIPDHRRPMIGFCGPLYETPSSFNERFVPWLTMLTQIPDLGVVIAGCQRGRAGIFTLLQLEGDAGTTITATTTAAAAAAATAAAASGANRGSMETEATLHTEMTSASAPCAFRLDHTLPTLDQEEAKQRPSYRSLVGIATAPLQGVKSFGGQPSRWRLVLTYSDCTLLSYELRRSSAGIEVDSLII